MVAFIIALYLGLSDVIVGLGDDWLGAEHPPQSTNVAHPPPMPVRQQPPPFPYPQQLTRQPEVHLCSFQSPFLSKYVARPLCKQHGSEMTKSGEF